MSINLIGISGRMTSGKSTLGEMIQNLTGYDQKQFAGPLKDIACILLGCSRDKLESQEYKASILGPEWDEWCYNSELPPYRILSRHTSQEVALQYKKEGLASGIDECNFWNLHIHQMTVRTFLQRLGTNAMRDGLHGNVWVNALFSQFRSGIIDEGGFAGATRAEQPNVYNSKWIITDCRFPNEANAIKDRRGIIIRISRGEEVRGEGLHESETALDNYDFDYQISNNGSLEDLYQKAKDFLSAVNIIKGNLVT